LGLPGRGKGTTNSQSEPQTAQPDLIFQFAKQRFHFLSLALGAVKRWRVGQLPCALPRRFFPVDVQGPKRAAGAVSF